jgi:hypothetical protein
VDFSNDLRDLLGEKFAEIPLTTDGPTLRRFSRECFEHLLSNDEREALRQFASGECGSGVFLYGNLPFEHVEWGPRPGQPAHEAKRTLISEAMLYAVASVAAGGDVYCPLGEAGNGTAGKVPIADIVPTEADRLRFTGHGSQTALGMHAENCAWKFALPGFDLAPKALLLTGVSQQPNGPVTPAVVSARALSHLKPEHIDRLRRPAVYHRLPVRQRLEGHDQLIGPLPVIFGRPGKEEIWASFYGDMVKPVDAAAKAALAALEESFAKEAVALSILPGTMAVITHNGRVLHGRSAFDPVIDAQGRARRWLQRLFLTARLDEVSHMPQRGDRVFELTAPR